jgi:hypothetical protein
VSIGIPRQLSACGLSVALAAGCTLSPPPATPAPTTVERDSTTPVKSAISWKPQHSAGRWRYELRSRATVTLTGDTSAKALPIGRTTIYTVTIAPSKETAGGALQLEVTGSVDSVSVTTPERIPTPTAGSDIRPRFHARLASGGQLIDLSSDATTACQQAIDPLSAAAMGLFVTLPPAISVGTSWSDTISTVTCRGRMPIITTAVRQYRVIKDTLLANTRALQLARTDSIHVSNRPDTAADQMKADGAGSATFTLYVDPKSGMLLNAAGQSHTEILVTAGDSLFPFREDARQTITLIR